MRGDVHFDVGVSELLAGQRGPHPAQHRADPGDQLARAERLGHIIVGAGLEAADPVALLAARGEHDDRHVGGLARRRSRRQTSMPDMPSIIQSRRMTSGGILVGQDQRLLAVAGAA